MDQKLKERFVGLAVLLVLGVIFIPWVLDGDKAASGEVQKLSLPVPATAVTHELNFESGHLTRVDIPVPSQSDDSEKIVADSASEQDPEDIDRTSDKPESAVTSRDQVSDSKTAQKVTTRTSTDVVSKATNTASQTKLPAKAPVKVSTGKAIEKQAEIERVESDPSAAWVVQTGSFSERKNAEKFISELKTKGFPAFLSRYVNHNEKVLYRVRVGPEKERSRAEKLAERLLKAGTKGQVVAHP